MGLSPRRQAWLALGALAVAIVVGANLPFEWMFAVWLVASVAFGAFRLLQRCPRCGERATWRRMEILGVEARLRTPLPPKFCEHCGFSLEGKRAEP